MTDDQGGRPSSCETVPEGGVWGVRSEIGHIVYGKPPSDTARQVGTG